MGRGRDKGHRTQAESFSQPTFAWVQGSLDARLDRREKTVVASDASLLGRGELVSPATWLSHDAIKPLQTTLLASHLAAKSQCLLHALAWRRDNSRIILVFCTGAGLSPAPSGWSTYPWRG